MAEGKKIKYEDLFDPKLDDQVKSLENTFKSLKDSLKEFAAVAGKEIKMTGMKTPEDMQKLAKGINDVETAAQSLKIVEDEEIKAKIRWKEAEKERTAVLKAQVQATQASAGSIDELRAKLALVTLQWKKLSEAERESSDKGKELVAQKKALTDQLSKLEQKTGDYRRNVGNYTESIEGAINKTGIFSEALEKLHKVQSIAAAILKVLTIGKKEHTEAVVSDTVATESNNAATTTSAAVIEAATLATVVSTEAEVLNAEEKVVNTVATELNVVATEAQVVATESAAVATGGFTKALTLLKVAFMESGIGLVIVALGATAKVLYDNATASQIAKDKIEALEASTAAYGKKLDIVGKSAEGYAKKAYDMSLAEKDLEDAEIRLLVPLEKKRALAAQARLDAEEEGRTTQEKIKALDTYLGLLEEVSGESRAEAMKKFARSIGAVQSEIVNGQIVATYDLEKVEKLLAQNREVRASDFDKNAPKLRANIDEANKAAKAVLEIDKDLARESLRATKRRTTMIEKDYADRKDLLRNAMKEENEILKNETEKKIATENTRFEIELETIRKNQAKLGATTQEEKDQFQREIEAAEALHKNNLFAISEAARLKEAEAQKKANDEEKKRRADLMAFYNKSIDEQIFAIETERIDKQNQDKLMFVDKIDIENRLYAWRIQKAGLSYDELERLRVEHEAKLKEITSQGGDGGAEFKLLVKEREDYLKEQQKQLEKEQEQVRKAAEQMLTAVEDGLKERAKLEQDADQKAIDNQKKQVDRQAQLAAAGKENSLAAEEAFLAKAERKKIDDAKKAQKQQESLELAKVFLNLVAEYSKTNPDNATAKALAMTLIAKGISKSIAGAFATGVEGLDGEGTETSDSNLALLSKGESVITAKGTRANPGLASAMNSGMVDEYFNSVYMPQFASSNRLDIPKAEQVNNALFKVLNHKLESLESAIREKPVSMTKLNGLGEWTEEVQSNNMRIITHHRKGGNRF